MGSCETNTVYTSISLSLSLSVCVNERARIVLFHRPSTRTDGDARVRSFLYLRTLFSSISLSIDIWIVPVPVYIMSMIHGMPAGRLLVVYMVCDMVGVLVLEKNIWHCLPNLFVSTHATSCLIFLLLWIIYISVSIYILCICDLLLC